MARSFDPGDSELEAVIRKFEANATSVPAPAIIAEPLHKDFIAPASAGDVRAQLDRVPAHFLRELKAVFILGGSNKQAQAFRAAFAYGRYIEGMIFLHAFPKERLSRVYKTPLKPSDTIEYARAGAVVETKAGKQEIRFDRTALKRFYCRDVLMHELGHHVEETIGGHKTYKKSEGFANWFAGEYGYRLRNY